MIYFNSRKLIDSVELVPFVLGSFSIHFLLCFDKLVLLEYLLICEAQMIILNIALGDATIFHHIYKLL